MNVKKQLRVLLRLTEYALIWSAIFMFYVVIRFANLNNIVTDVSVYQIPFTFGGLLFLAFSIGLLFGTATGIIERYFFNKKVEKLPFSLIVLIKSAVYFLTVFMVMGIADILTFLYFNPYQYSGVLPELIDYYSSGSIQLILFYVFVCSIIFTLIRNSNRLLGRGTLLNYLLGRYHRPKVENRIFLFVDLKGSTSIAERIGHIQYARLVQECFGDLTKPVLSNNGNIYKYVGDEAIITWLTSDKDSYNQSLQCFFDFKRLIGGKRAFYLDEFDVLPEFRGGVHGGEVTVAEIGKVKSEIAYHGDVLNSASRMLDLAKADEHDIVLSDEILKNCNKQKNIKIEYKDEIQLKGKEEKIKIYSAAMVNGVQSIQ